MFAMQTIISRHDAFVKEIHQPDCLRRYQGDKYPWRMPAKDLSEGQKADAARLKAAFKAWQAEQKEAGRPHSQEALADSMGFGQSALSQYLNGLIPLNGPALLKFCHYFGVKPSTISPTIAEAERSRAMQWVGPVVRIGEPAGNPGLVKDRNQKARTRLTKKEKKA
jgi:hypothetical protein